MRLSAICFVLNNEEVIVSTLNKTVVAFLNNTVLEMLFIWQTDIITMIMIYVCLAMGSLANIDVFSRLRLDILWYIEAVTVFVTYP